MKSRTSKGFCFDYDKLSYRGKFWQMLVLLLVMLPVVWWLGQTTPRRLAMLVFLLPIATTTFYNFYQWRKNR